MEERVHREFDAWYEPEPLPFGDVGHVRRLVRGEVVLVELVVSIGVIVVVAILIVLIVKGALGKVREGGRRVEDPNNRREQSNAHILLASRLIDALLLERLER